MRFFFHFPNASKVERKLKKNESKKDREREKKNYLYSIVTTVVPPPCPIHGMRGGRMTSYVAVPTKNRKIT